MQKKTSSNKGITKEIVARLEKKMVAFLSQSNLHCPEMDKKSDHAQLWMQNDSLWILREVFSCLKCFPDTFDKKAVLAILKELNKVSEDNDNKICAELDSTEL